ncbi:hypothetical protein HKCCSP123_10790 [Rhodobacterales bacterium HKCCSP123]|nr:hypothetical protein [Rhodobacterales bacterium HKCCSP123]
MWQPIAFLEDETGAVTVDWVVLTAGLVALGIAVVSVVSSGVENQSGDIANFLASIPVLREAVTTVAAFDFSGGLAAGWIGGQVMDMGGQLGELLVLGPGQSTGFRLQVPEGTSMASMTFDLVAGDSLDNNGQWGADTAFIMINGVAVAIASNDHEQTIHLEIPQIDGTIVNATVTANPSSLGGQSGYTDTVTTVTVEVEEPTGALQFSVMSNANQGIGDEYWGIDNFSADLTGGPGF